MREEDGLLTLFNLPGSVVVLLSLEPAFFCGEENMLLEEPCEPLCPDAEDSEVLDGILLLFCVGGEPTPILLSLSRLDDLVNLSKLDDFVNLSRLDAGLSEDFPADLD